ncbi:hypothetical protein [Roseitalea porphyridii]|uniref:Uncharacterized protein n=1 Tax=Roseitalea porphyridii TaxID=1852022 RepID=A0A4P6V1F5_9HYPH|nr:hypothetical protein [Roseitalea porphyridii]QBK30955.1 hypothetical protein E0E05_10345 [Roseitalea porphyridii]
MSDGASRAASRAQGIRLAIAAPALAAAIAVWTLASLTLRFGWALGPQPVTVAAIFGAGAGIGFAIAAFFATLVATGTRRRMALTFGIAVATILASTLALYFLEHRAYFSQWHGPALSRVWFIQQFYTGVAAAGHVAVLGTRYLGLPALALLALASWWTHRNAD